MEQSFQNVLNFENMKWKFHTLCETGEFKLICNKCFPFHNRKSLILCRSRKCEVIQKEYGSIAGLPFKIIGCSESRIEIQDYTDQVTIDECVDSNGWCW